MRKILLGIFSGAIGIIAAVILHCSFMIVKIDGSDMLPTLEPDQRVLVFLLEDSSEIKEGDLVAYYPPFYQIDGGRGPMVKRVDSLEEGEMKLVSDTSLTDEDKFTVASEDILGKVIVF